MGRYDFHLPRQQREQIDRISARARRSRGKSNGPDRIARVMRVTAESSGGARGELGEIDAGLGLEFFVSPSTIRGDRYDPFGLKAKQRAWREAGRCAFCGGRTTGAQGSSRAPEVCRDCYVSRGGRTYLRELLQVVTYRRAIGIWPTERQWKDSCAVPSATSLKRRLDPQSRRLATWVDVIDAAKSVAELVGVEARFADPEHVLFVRPAPQPWEGWRQRRLRLRSHCVWCDAPSPERVDRGLVVVCDRCSIEPGTWLDDRQLARRFVAWRDRAGAWPSRAAWEHGQRLPGFDVLRHRDSAGTPAFAGGGTNPLVPYSAPDWSALVDYVIGRALDMKTFNETYNQHWERP